MEALLVRGLLLLLVLLRLQLLLPPPSLRVVVAVLLQELRVSVVRIALMDLLEVALLSGAVADAMGCAREPVRVPASWFSTADTCCTLCCLHPRGSAQPNDGQDCTVFKPCGFHMHAAASTACVRSGSQLASSRKPLTLEDVLQSLHCQPRS